MYDPFDLDYLDIPNMPGSATSYSPMAGVTGTGANFRPENYYNLNHGGNVTVDGPTRTPLADAYRRAHTKVGPVLEAGLAAYQGWAQPAVDRINSAIRVPTPAAMPGPLGKAGRLAGNALGSKFGQMAVKAAPALGVAGAALGVGDILLGNDSAGNKAMDSAAMAAGGAIGGFLGGGVFSPVTAAIGAGVGKTLSDATQFIVGGGKSEREKQIEALLASRGGI